MRSEDKLKNHYNPRLDKYEETHKILDWESQDAQLARFKILLDNVDLNGCSIIDVGCGCGDLFGLLKDQGIEVDYTGVDILPGMIEKAQSLHGDGTFLCGDLFGGESFCVDQFDVVFTSGIFNLNLGNNEAFFNAALPVLNSHAKKALVINLLDEKSPDRDDTYFYFDPREVVKKIEALGRTVTLIDDYLANDFTIIAKAPSQL